MAISCFGNQCWPENIFFPSPTFPLRFPSPRLIQSAVITLSRTASNTIRSVILSMCPWMSSHWGQPRIQVMSMVWTLVWIQRWLTLYLHTKKPSQVNCKYQQNVSLSCQWLRESWVNSSNFELFYLLVLFYSINQREQLPKDANMFSSNWKRRAAIFNYCFKSLNVGCSRFVTFDHRSCQIRFDHYNKTS